MKITHNLSENHLLFGQDVDFVVDGEIISMHLPKLKHCFFNFSFQHFIYLLNAPLKELTQKIPFVQNIETLFDFLLIIILYKDAGTQLYYNSLITSLNILFDDVKIEQGQIIIYNTKLNKEWFDLIQNVVLVATQHKKLHQIMNNDPAMQALEDRINKIKQQNKNNTSNSDSLEELYMILTYEFGYSKEEILNMTMYAITKITKYTSSSINYKISLIGAGNGLSKKVHFITKKGK